MSHHHHPVQLTVDRTPHIPRIHVVIRLALLVALSAIGYSSLYGILYLAIPALVGLLIVHRGGERYVTEDAPRIVRALRWLAVAYAYLWFLTDFLPTSEGSPVDLQIQVSGTPTVTSAVSRLLYSLPALLLVAVLSVAAGLVWVVAAVFVLATERMPGALADFLALVLRVQFRLAAYHLSLVDRYPSLQDQAAPSHARKEAHP